MGWRKELLNRVDNYCKATGRARSGVSKLIMNDPRFFDEIEEGRSCTVDNLERVNKWFEENSPKPA